MTENMTIAALSAKYKNGDLKPPEIMSQIRARAEKYQNRNIWIHLLSEDEIETYMTSLAKKDPAESPLWEFHLPLKIILILLAFLPRQHVRLLLIHQKNLHLLSLS